MQEKKSTARIDFVLLWRETGAGIGKSKFKTATL
jgi:hypothetical protein